MKAKNLILSLIVVFTAVLMQNCQEDPEPIVSSDSILPSKFSVDIPNSISSNNAKSLKNTKGDSLSGNDIYEHLSTFIWIGEAAAEIVGISHTGANNKLRKLKRKKIVKDIFGR